mmetsp:Transcript_113592/g.316053  ORF Transcript_113592/g.316053 Transcript_113592/m.316053 type:complete len:211 (-) Transcript_113592:60-692(-)
MSNSSFVILLHIGAMWWYQGFTRDHLLARHVTQISFEKPISEVRAGEAVVALVETGPWTRRLELRPPAPGAAETVPLGQLAQLGAVHIDEGRGEVLDRAALDLLMGSHLRLASEELRTDEEASRRAFVAGYEVAPLLQDDAEGMHQRLAELPNVLQRPLRWRGSSAMRNFGLAALAMAAGSVASWLPPGALPLPESLARWWGPRKRVFEY